MQREFRILEVRRGSVLVQPLDAVKEECLRVARATTYIENEVIIAEPLSDRSGVSSQWEVIAARVDPSFIDGGAPKVVPCGNEEAGTECRFAEYVSSEEEEDFEDALEALRSGDHVTAARLLRAFIRRFPYHIDSYHHLGIIETDRGRRGRALKYFEMGYRIGLRSVSEGFSGTLPWIHLENRPFLRAAHGYGLALELQRRHLDAVDVYERILAWNPNDNQGVRYLLPSLYLQARAPQKARATLERHGADGMNLYTRCLLEIQDGRRREALRWLCRALSYNLYLPRMVLAGKKVSHHEATCTVVVGSEHEAGQYLRENGGWLRKPPRDFLQRLMAMKPFVRR
ncbi:MAG: tetratricopeptide repeat protein, partial [Planctomycetes bacterium]|nr:tetratricopeptide repeat protein [Planctomycetota bacterium]